MKRKLFPIQYATLALPFVYLLNLWLTELLHWPQWVLWMVYFVGIFAFVEIMGRLGQNEPNTPIAGFLELSRYEKNVVLIVALLMFFVGLPLVLSLSSTWSGGLVVVNIVICGWVVCRMVGGRRLGYFLLTGAVKHSSLLGEKSETPKRKKNKLSAWQTNQKQSSAPQENNKL